MNSLEDTYIFILNDTNHYDKNYQHEVLPFDYTIPYEWIKNKFVAESDELISAFSTYFLDNSIWQADVYVNGELKHTQNGTAGIGYYTMVLSEYIPVKADDVFEIALKTLNSQDNSAAIRYLFGASSNSRINSPYQSFVSNDGENWLDLYDYEGSEKFKFCEKSNTNIKINIEIQ